MFIWSRCEWVSEYARARARVHKHKHLWMWSTRFWISYVCNTRMIATSQASWKEMCAYFCSLVLNFLFLIPVLFRLFSFYFRATTSAQPCTMSNQIFRVWFVSEFWWFCLLDVLISKALCAACTISLSLLWQHVHTANIVWSNRIVINNISSFSFSLPVFSTLRSINFFILRRRKIYGIFWCPVLPS